MLINSRAELRSLTQSDPRWRTLMGCLPLYDRRTSGDTLFCMEPSMRVLLQNEITRQYLAPDSTWRTDSYSARDFISAVEALGYLRRHPLFDTQIIFKFDNGRYDMTLTAGRKAVSAEMAASAALAAKINSKICAQTNCAGCQIEVDSAELPGYVQQIPAPCTPWRARVYCSPASKNNHLTIVSLGGFGSFWFDVGGRDFTEGEDNFCKKIYPGVYVRRSR